MKYIFTGLSLKGLNLNIDIEKLKASQDKELSDAFLDVIEEKGELEIGDLKFKYIASVDEMSTEGCAQKRRKF